MSLDQNLFTLVFTPNKDNNNVIDLVDPSGTIHYRKQRIPCVEYKIEIYGSHVSLVVAYEMLISYRSHVRISACDCDCPSSYEQG